jgi:prophage DNA circulation protein
MATPQWKLDLQPASYNGVAFFVEVNSRASGRRIANHEYPKRDQPYAEDMGRKSRTFPVTGYVIGSNYTNRRDALIRQLEAPGPATLILPTGLERVGSNQVTIENFSVTERRERGGIATFDMLFREAGAAASSVAVSDTQGQVTNSVNSAMASSSAPAGTVFVSGTSPIQFANIANSLIGTSDIPPGGAGFNVAGTW